VFLIKGLREVLSVVKVLRWSTSVEVACKKVVFACRVAGFPKRHLQRDSLVVE